MKLFIHLLINLFSNEHKKCIIYEGFHGPKYSWCKCGYESYDVPKEAIEAYEDEPKRIHYY